MAAYITKHPGDVYQLVCKTGHEHNLAGCFDELQRIFCPLPDDAFVSRVIDALHCIGLCGGGLCVHGDEETRNADAHYMVATILDVGCNPELD